PPTARHPARPQRRLPVALGPPQQVLGLQVQGVVLGAGPPRRGGAALVAVAAVVPAGPPAAPAAAPAAVHPAVPVPGGVALDQAAAVREALDAAAHDTPRAIVRATAGAGAARPRGTFRPRGDAVLRA